MPDYFDPFNTRDPNKIQDRVQPGRANFWENPPEADVSRNAPNIGAPILPPNLTPGPRYTPVDYDPFQRAAERVQRSVRPPGGRTEGMLTSLPEDVLIPKTPLDVAVMAAGGPMGRLAKLATVAGGAALTSSDAEAGPINKVISAGGSAIERLVNGIRAYHGSPHDFDKFDLSKIGTGEGAQSYGHGLYFAENPAVAGEYKKRLASPYNVDTSLIRSASGDLPLATEHVQAIRSAAADAGITPLDAAKRIQWRYPELRDKGFAGSGGDMHRGLMAAVEQARNAGRGHMYEVNINAKPEQFLDWDKPVLQQPQHHSALDRFGVDPANNQTGEEVFRGLQSSARKGKLDPAIWAADADAHVTQVLRDKAGIPGIKYLDQGSRRIDPVKYDPVNGKWRAEKRESGELVQRDFSSEAEARSWAPNQTNNYVLFSDDIVKILRKYGLGGLTALPPATAAAIKSRVHAVDYDPFSDAE